MDLSEMFQMASPPSFLLTFFTLGYTLLAGFSVGTLVKPRIYEIRNVNATCTSQQMRIRLELNRNFQGVVYAKGFPLEKNCGSLGTGDNFVEISLDASACGVRLVSADDENHTFRVTLTVQMDKFLQQINDLEVGATCDLSTSDLIYPRHFSNKQTGRTGRNKATQTGSENHDEILNKVKTWMEIEGTSESNNVNKVAVGEQTMVLIKSILPENIVANAIDCYAYDGTRDVIQKLLDDNGCPLDETIMPSLEVIKTDDEDFTIGNEISWEAGTESGDAGFRDKLEKAKREKSRKSVRRDKPESAGPENVELIPERREKTKMRFQVIGTMFPAFKFPDTANLHLKCTLQICRKVCPTVSCDSNTDPVQDRMGKSVKSRNSSTVIDKIEVFNSVEVVAPGIDSDGYSTSSDGINSVIKSEGNTFCLSASKMAFSFAILGAIFLCGVLAALWTVMRNHMRKVNKIDGSEQILVVRDSPMNFTYARNKMYHNWIYS